MTGSWRLFLLCSLLQGAGCMGRFEVLMQARVTTLNGSCVTVPCSFTVEDGYNDKLLPECIPTWRKDRITFSTTTFKGNLTAYNCTTTFNDVLEDNGQYDLRIDCGYPLKYNFEKDPVTIQIEGLPDAPRLTPPMEPVVEGTPVELGCSAPSYCDTHPPTVTWTPALGPSTQLQQNDTVTSTLTFNASLLHHGNNVSCTAAYYIPSGNKTVTSTRYQLSILYAPRNTSAVGSPCLPAREGGCLNLTCSSHANPAVSEFTWYRIHGEHILKIGSGSPLSIQLSNSSNVFFCEVRNVFGTEKSNVYKIDIQNAPRNTSAVGSPCLPAGEGGCLNLTCSSHANPAVSAVTWYRIHGEHILKIGSGSSLSIQLWNANDVFFCEVRNDFGTEKSTVYKIDIQNAPRNPSAVGSPCLPAREGGCLNLTCSSHANPAVSEVTWYRMHGEHILKIGTGSSLSIQLWSTNDVFFCEVRNDFGTEKSNVYKIDIQTPPRILPASSCSRIAAWVRCSCDSVGRPSPSLEWRLDGKLVLGSEDVSVSQVNLENATLRSSLTMRAPAGPTALTCHSSNAAGNTSQELPVPHLDTQPNLTDLVLCIVKSAVMFVGLVCVVVCITRTRRVGEETRSFNAATVTRAPPDEEESQVIFGSEEDDYVNSGMQMNPVGPRE
ncbi:sialic acid-binding Ig-like lectin 5 isoform X1 [Gadus macrocephalus]|uniref:sialic acid-binding Ig-like lectin 5 isoform X1 n=1 Tax=Gadus macrocephalus TaxID=80720 RepID=UPI0028CB9A9C|nr:sialic acid-binding Ig-like lectin 5 isoform X1 [Gadus macrocephalus]